MSTCAICKQEIENSAFAVYSDKAGGYVHQGSCQAYAESLPLKEHGGDTQLNETELLL